MSGRAGDSKGRLFRNLAWLVVLVLLVSAAVVVWFQGGDLFSPSRQTDVVRVFREASPAVVSLSSKPISKELDLGRFEHKLPPRAREFFRRFYGAPAKEDLNLGSGIIVDSDGFILTNEHLVINTEWIEVKLADGRTVSGEIWGNDPSLDLAVIKVDVDTPLPALEKGSSGNLMIGEPVIVIGNPLGMGATCSQGIVSALNREVQTGPRLYKNLIQIDAPVNPGNSGGPVLNIKGEVIGLTSAIAPQAEGIGFAVPIDPAWKVVEDLIEYRYVPSGWLGLSVKELGSASEAAGGSTAGGVFVSRVEAKGPSSEYFQPGDIIKSWNGTPVKDVAGFARRARNVRVDDRVVLERFREGASKKVSVNAAAFPEDLAEEWAQAHLGLGVEESPVRRRTSAGKTLKRRGVYVADVLPGSPAHVVGLVPGDLVMRINRTRINDLQEFRKAVCRYRNRKNVLVRAGRRHFSFSVTVPFSLGGERW
ncbi:MAG: trypsin-like peptidase domain-containing protein [bacterium]